MKITLRSQHDVLSATWIIYQTDRQTDILLSEKNLKTRDKIATMYNILIIYSSKNDTLESVAT